MEFDGLSADAAGAPRKTLNVDSRLSSSGSGRRLRLGMYFVVWYVSSAICNTSSRAILTVIPVPLLLCVSQFAFAVIATYVTLTVVRGQPRPVPVPGEAKRLMNKLALVYTMGFVFVNAGYLVVNVSLAETLRSLEPVVSVVLARLWLRDEPVSLLTQLTLVPIVLGGSLSSAGDRSFSMLGLFFVCISNASFSMRSVYAKHLKPVYGVDAVNVFFQLSFIGLQGLVGLCCALAVFGALVSFGPLSGVSLGVIGTPSAPLQVEDVDVGYVFKLVLANGVTYALYNQMSFLVLAEVEMVTHAVGNAFRRVVTIVWSVFLFRNPVNPTNAAGIFLAVFGVVAYSLSKKSPSPSPALARRNGNGDVDVEMASGGSLRHTGGAKADVEDDENHQRFARKGQDDDLDGEALVEIVTRGPDSSLMMNSEDGGLFRM